jgi:very-short-patch-repair endonuclease
MRNAPTPSEARLWKALRRLNREGARFRRQVSLDGRIFDFGDLTARRLIEVDGGVHLRLPEVAERDAEKSAWASANRFRLIRVSNDQVWGDLDAVVAIRIAIQEASDD